MEGLAVTIQHDDNKGDADPSRIPQVVTYGLTAADSIGSYHDRDDRDTKVVGEELPNRRRGYVD